MSSGLPRPPIAAIVSANNHHSTVNPGQFSINAKIDDHGTTIGMGMPECRPNLCRPRPKSQQTKLSDISSHFTLKRLLMKKLSILVPAAAAGILLSAMVLAAPLQVAGKAPVAQAPDRAAAYLAASAD